ncbi:unnamed protein product [Ostreobium quekettii]|uniref:Uncharacterized protein n=1 Tax=Ostreobium quekettii TaxID=121088 RepID=A0A8S1IPL3_9CHLO|nr:unnamed protein product [Ostreobium quekettii]
MPTWYGYADQRPIVCTVNTVVKLHPLLLIDGSVLLPQPPVDYFPVCKRWINLASQRQSHNGSEDVLQMRTDAKHCVMKAPVLCHTSYGLHDRKSLDGWNCENRPVDSCWMEQQ